jgi:dolichol-phosphate mannosyltransferase
MVGLSIVIPARNEAENIRALIDAIVAVCAAAFEFEFEFEIIVVDDGSDDGMTAVLDAALMATPNLRVIRHDRSAGQSAALHSGVKAARHDLICTLDGDGQNPPFEIPRLVAPLASPDGEAIGLVAGQRVGRKDSWSRKLASRFANMLRKAVLRDGTRDTGCGLKAFRRTAFLQLPYFDHMHRYLPALFSRDGWQIAHIDVSHLPRGGGRSHYSNLQRGLVGIIDLMGVAWLLHRRKKCRPTEVIRTESVK